MRKAFCFLARPLRGSALLAAERTFTVCYRRALIVFTIIAGIVVFVMAAHAAESDLRKLDRISQIQLERWRLSGVLKPAQQVALVVELAAGASVVHLPAAGFATRFCSGSFCTGQLALERLEELLSKPWIVAASLVDLGRPDTKMGRFQRPVIIGIIDKGFYWRDPAFRSSFGSRILYLWDQTDPQGPGPAMMPVPYGTEFNGFQLEELFNAHDLLPSRFGHGFGIAHIAGGNGEADQANAGSQFLDLKVTSPLIFVNTTGHDDGVLDAVAYVVRRSEQLGAAAVINLSYTRHIGPHDGTELLTRAIDATLGNRNLLVVAVGNDGQRNLYARVDLPIKSPLAFSLDNRNCDPESGRFSLELEGWYDASLSLQFSLTPPDGISRTAMADSGLGAWQTTAGSVLIDATLVSSSGTKKGLFITIEGNCKRADQHVWQLNIRPLHASPKGTFEVWIRRTVSCTAAFQTAHRESAISSLSTGYKVLSVGAWRQDAARGVIEAEPYSSYGFTGDGRRKPDVLAPGTTSYRVATLDDTPATEGTSTAAALVTRVIAHLWQFHRDVDASSLKRLFDRKILLARPTHASINRVSGYETVSVDELESMLKNAGSESSSCDREDDCNLAGGCYGNR